MANHCKPVYLHRVCFLLMSAQSLSQWEKTLHMHPLLSFAEALLNQSQRTGLGDTTVLHKVINIASLKIDMSLRFPFVTLQVYTFGTTGMMTYDIGGTDYKVAILWQVPWNTVVYNVLFNIKVSEIWVMNGL